MSTKTTIEILPIFRTNAQWLVLTHLFVLTGEAELVSTSDIARHYGMSQSTINDEVRRLVDAELVLERRAGRTRLLEANFAHPTAHALRELLSLTCGPLCTLQALYNQAGVMTVHIFGSYARRYLNEPGPFPRDLDLIIVGDEVDETDIGLDCVWLGRELSIEIKPWIVSTSDWARPAEGSVLAQVKDGPLVEIRR